MTQPLRSSRTRPSIAQHAEAPEEEEARRAAERLAQALANAEVLSARMEGFGLSRVFNDGADQNLCSVISLLHLANWGDEAPRQAHGLLGQMYWRSDELGEALRRGDGVYSDPEHFRPMAEAIFGAGGVPPIAIVTAGGRGEALLFDPLYGAPVHPEDLGPDVRLVFEQPGHFEAVRNDSGRPLAELLPQLALAPGAPWVGLMNPADIDDGAMLLSFNQAPVSGMKPKTKSNQIDRLRRFKKFLKNDPQPSSLQATRETLRGSTAPWEEEPHIAAYGISKGKWAAKEVAVAFKHVITGGAVPRGAHPVTHVPSPFIDKHVKKMKAADPEAKPHIQTLHHFNEHLLGLPDSVELETTVAKWRASDADLDKDPLILGFRDTVGPRSHEGKVIVSALRSMVTGVQVRRPPRAEYDRQDVIDLKGFRDYLASTDASPSTQETYRLLLTRFAAWQHEHGSSLREALRDLGRVDPRDHELFQTYRDQHGPDSTERHAFYKAVRVFVAWRSLEPSSSAPG